MFNTMKEIKDLADSIPGYTAVYKIGNNVERIYNSDNLADLLGYTKEEFSGETGSPLRFIYQEDLQGVKTKMEQAVRQHEKLDLTYRFVHKTGRTQWVRLHGNYIGDMDGQAIYLASIYDISDEWKLRDSILDSSDRGIVVFDRDTKIVLYGNDKFFKFAETTKQSCLGQPCYKVVCRAGVYDKTKCICFQAIGHTEPISIYNEVSDCYYEISASEIMWGEHAAIIFYMADITTAKKKDREIAEKNERLNKIQEEAILNYKKQLETITDGDSDMMSTCRLNLTKNTCIPGTCRTDIMRDLQNEGTAEGYFRLGTAHMDKTDLQAMKSYPNVENLLAAFANGEETVSGDGYITLEPGKTLYVRTTVHMAQNPVTQDIEAVLYTRDLTDTKLRNDIMKCLMEKQYESISVINLESRRVSVLSYNYDGVAGIQYDGEDYDICRSFFIDTYVMAQDKESYRKCSDLSNITRELDAEGHYISAFHFRGENEETRFKTIEYYYTDERHHTIIGATRDITEVTLQQQKSMDELKTALLRADRATEAKSAFFSNISHDMRTPLNGILGFSGLGREAETVEEARSYFDKIDSSGKFLLKLINDTLDISKIESGQMKLKLAKVNVDEMLRETVNAVEETAHEKGVDFCVAVPKNKQAFVAADKLRLEQLLTNLLGNAIKFTPQGGTVRFTVREPQNPGQDCHYNITIEDNGIGMKKEFVPHAFEAYTQDENEATVKAMGTGLGLAIVKQIVTMMKGEITLTSEEGKGTRYDIRLPLEAVQAEEPEEKTKSRNVSLEGKHILLCEDHPINRELACRLLERKGMKITCAENGKIGVARFAESEPGTFDAILMDIRMPEMNGLEAAEAIRGLDRTDAAKIPIIAMTANAYESDKKAASRFGMNAHLAKPIDPKMLYSVLDEYINAVPPEAEAKAPTPWKPKVIVVDDIEINIAVIKVAIEGRYEVFEAADGRQALQILEKEPGIAAVITDIQMPGMDGVQLIQAMRADHDYDRVAILANTQHGSANQEETLLAMGADDFIYKPTIASLVLARLNNVIRKYK